MRITIAERFKPFSHLPGTICVLPGTSLRFQIFPALIRVFEEDIQIAEISVNTSGAVTNFTVQLDLEKPRIRVWGNTPVGYMRYSIYPSDNSQKYVLVHEKIPMSTETGKAPALPPGTFERLSLGYSKSLDWQMVSRRQEIAEILPVWFFLGQQMPKQNRAPCEGTAAFLHDCRRAIINGDSRLILQPFKSLFQSGFDFLLAPRKTDTAHWGHALPPVTSDFSSTALLSEGAELIRSLFFSYNDRVIDILPALPVELHAGRFIDLKCGTQGALDMEWTKKAIRRVIFRAAENGAVRFALPREIKEFRLRTSESDRGQKIAAKTPVEITAGGLYYLDRFQH